MPGEIILDTQLLVLYVVGLASPRYIKQHKRLRDVYTEVDFDLLSSMLERASRVIVPVNVYTEASNFLSSYIAEPARTRIMEKFRELIMARGEDYVPSERAAGRPEFIRLGLADAALLDAGDPSWTLLTADYDLYAAACRCHRPVENFNHIREAYL
jgi:hypothetical protein